VLLLVALVLRLVIAWMPVPLLISKTIPDDAYYYFVVARNVASGQGLSFDGRNPTNGFHPLWLLPLIAFYALFPESEHLPIHLALTLAAFLDLGTAWMAFLTLRHLTGDSRLGLVASLLYLFSPIIAFHTVSGLETVLSTFLFASCCFYYLTRIAPCERISVAQAALFGLLGGLMGLARTDHLVIWAVFLSHWLWQEMRAHRHVVGAHIYVPLLVAFLVGMAVLSPWFLWNLHTFGTVMQSSGVATPYVARQHFFILNREHFPNPVINFLSVTVYLLSKMVQAILAYSWPELFIVVAAVLLGVSLKEKSLLVPLAGATLMLGVHLFWRWFVRGWYYVPWAYSFILVAASLFHGIITKWQRGEMPLRLSRVRAHRGVLLHSSVPLLILVGLLVQGGIAWQQGLYPWQDDMYRGALWLSEHLPPSVKIGSFNAGIIAYYAPQEVVNLDGVVNWDALKAIMWNDLASYIRGEGIDYVLEWRAAVEFINRPFFGCELDDFLVEEMTMPRRFNDVMVLYKVRSDVPRIGKGCCF